MGHCRFMFYPLDNQKTKNQKLKGWVLYTVVPEPGGPGGPLAPPPYFADQLTLFEPGRADHPHLLLLAPPMFFTFRHHCYDYAKYLSVYFCIISAFKREWWSDWYHWDSAIFDRDPERSYKLFFFISARLLFLSGVFLYFWIFYLIYEFLYDAIIMMQ